jgi:hypothetical protein
MRAVGSLDRQLLLRFCKRPTRTREGLHFPIVADCRQIEGLSQLP